MSMFGRESVQYGRPLRGRQAAWIHRRSPRLVPLLRRAQAKTERMGTGLRRSGDNDNTAGQAAPAPQERHGWQPSLAAKQGAGSA